MGKDIPALAADCWLAGGGGDAIVVLYAGVSLFRDYLTKEVKEAKVCRMV